MGLGKWWMTYGPGSPGSIARAMAKSYVKGRARFPGSIHRTHLKMTLYARYSGGGPFGPIDSREVEHLVDLAEGKLGNLTMYVWARENPRVAEAMENAPNIVAEGLLIIQAETRKICPEADRERQPRIVTHNTNTKDYEELGLRPDASWGDIQAAYRAAMKVYHPDTLASKDLSPEIVKLSASKLQSIRAAYERLKKSR